VNTNDSAWMPARVRDGQGGLRPVGRITAVTKRKRPAKTGGRGPGGGWIGGIQRQGCRSDGRLPGGFSRNTWVMLPIRPTNQSSLTPLISDFHFAGTQLKRDFFIIGGGVAGLGAAYELLKRGHEVTVADYGHSGQSSWAGAGIVSTLQPWNFGEDVTSLALAGMKVWPAWADEISCISNTDPEFWECGMEYRDVPAPDAALEWCRKHDLPASSKSDGDLWLPTIAQVRNPRLLASLQAAVTTLGGRIMTACEITGIRNDGRKAVAVLSGETEYRAEAFIWARGAWSGLALGQAAPVPNIRPIRGQILLFAPGSHTLDHIVYRNGLYLVPRRDGHLLVGSTKENAGFNPVTTTEALKSLNDAACDLVPELSKHKPVKTWAGLRPGSPDNIPVIDRHPHYDNVWLHTGHYRYGVTMAPSSCRLLIEQIFEDTPHLDPSPYTWELVSKRSWGI